MIDNENTLIEEDRVKVNTFIFNELNEIPILDTRAWFHRLKLGSDTSNTALRNLVQVYQRSITDQLQHEEAILSPDTILRKKITKLESLKICKAYCSNILSYPNISLSHISRSKSCKLNTKS